MKPWISPSDVSVVKELDPRNVENWRPVYTDALDGWRFTLRPNPKGTEFIFLAFRSPEESGFWRIWLMSPNMDDRFGHHDHVVRTRIGGQEIPVLCSKPGSAPCRTLEEARSTSAKWAMYTEARRLGLDPKFSK